MLFSAQRQLGYPWFWISGVLILALIANLSSFYHQILLVLGLGFGATLNYFVFGFSNAWRLLILDKQTEGVRAHVWMICVASVLFLPLIFLGSIGDQSYNGLIRPVSLSVVVGAFLFGVGMQLAGRCSSGTLNGVGQLQPLSFLTFACLLVGGVVGAYFYGNWVQWPTLPPYSFIQSLEGAAIIFNFVLLFLAYRFLIYFEQKNLGQVRPLWQVKQGSRGKNTLIVASILLAALNFLVFFISGQPWSIASVFTVWGLKLSEVANLDLDWRFWDIVSLYGTRLERPLLDDSVSLTTIGVILGSLLVTLLNDSPAKREVFQWKNFTYALVGGLLMGFGATLSYGCNIGAFFSGVASGSLHGWIWILFAILGNIVALKIILKK